MKTTRYKFEQMVQEVNQDTKQWLKDEFKYILESHNDFTRKADYIGLSIISIDKKIGSLDDEIAELQAYKKRLKQAKEVALITGAEIFSDYGIDKIEGASISSLSLTKEKTTIKTKLEVINEEKLIQAGYYSITLDEEAIIKAFESEEESTIVSKYSYLQEEPKHTPSKLKVNKRRTNTATQEMVLR